MVSGQLDLAEQTFNRVLVQAPDLSIVKNDLAYLLAQQEKDLKRALKLAKEASDDLGESSSLLDTMGYIYLQQGRTNAALRYFRAAIARSTSTTPELQYHLGLALLALDQRRPALKAFTTALKVNPRFHQAPEIRQHIQSLEAQLTSAPDKS
jgi:tetratricopeptide (TPR) repeat protein